MTSEETSPASSGATAAQAPDSDRPTDSDRRSFLAATSSIAMVGGLAAGYGAFGAMAIRFLYPPDHADSAWQFVTTLADLKAGDSMEYVAPSGDHVVVARLGDGDTADNFIALSNVCPHLGCQVHWEEQNKRFFCPCHNGVFDREGVATEGPPFKAGQRLEQFSLNVVEGLLFIKAPMVQIGQAVAQHDARGTSTHSPTREA